MSFNVSEDIANDVNFCFPIPSVLESELVKLVPFRAEYSEEVIRQADDTLWKYVPLGPFTSASEFTEYCTSWQPDSSKVLFAIIDKACGTEKIAGVIAYVNTIASDLITEIGAVLILPAFRRTHVNSHASSLLLTYALDHLALRRVAWLANADNQASVNAAERLGFRKEGVLRWHRALPEGKIVGHLAPGKGPKPQHGSRDSVVLSVCCDDWEDGVKERIQKIMSRR